jgi:lipopolysaccharide export system permease protein
MCGQKNKEQWGVGRLDRYVLSQMLVMFGFFSLVLVALFWINRAVVLFDRLIADGQSALVFLEFTALGLPRLIVTVLPIASFAAAVYVTNRLSNESELTVMQATGSGPFRLARPVVIFGAIVFVMASVLTHFLLPTAQGQLAEREAEISRNATARLLTEGTFLNPSKGVTFYTRAIGVDGVLRDVFLSDRRSEGEGIIYTASEAYLVRQNDATTLIMVDGMAQRYTGSDGRLATANFRDFSFDISALVQSDTARSVKSSILATPALLAPWADIAARTGEQRGAIALELNERFAKPLFCLVAALIGFSMLLVGGYSRFGVWRQVGFAFGLLLLIDGLRSVFSDPVRDNASLWPLIYMPVLIGLVLSLGMLTYTSYPGLFRRRRTVVVA